MPHSTTAETASAPSLPTKTLKDNSTIPLYPLETISYSLINDGDDAERERLLKAARYPGFFWLDFRGSDEGQKILEDLKETYRVEGEYFDKHRSKPGMIDIEVKSSALQHSVPTLPEPLRPSLPLLTRLSGSLHAANLAVTKAVAPDYISSNPSSNNDDNNSKQSDTALDLIYAPTIPAAKDFPDTTHTDGGTMTILFSEAWGSKIQDPRTGQWGWLEPQQGCGLVNVGDSLAEFSRTQAGERVGVKGEWTGGEGTKGLHSCKHAVGQTEDGESGRLFVVHYLRPWKEQ